MISALADAGAALERADYVAAAVDLRARSSRRELRDASGALLRTFNRGRAKLPAFLEDHAYLLEAYLTLYEATFDARWFARARRARRRRSWSASTTRSAAASSPSPTTTRA